MTTQEQILSEIPVDFPDHARVWIYQSNRLLRLNEAMSLETRIEPFLQKWNTHGKPVKGYINLFYGRFLLIMADESNEPVSGCSTDSTVQWVRELGKAYGVDFFDRLNLAFFVKDRVEVIPLTQVPYALSHGLITADTLFFDNSITRKSDLQSRWLVPVKESWLKRYIQG